LQADAFSCRDAPDFNSDAFEIANVHAAFTCIGGCASINAFGLRSKFAVAKRGNHSYSWQALKTASHRRRQHFFRLSITDN
jgi:hypothetical protein